MGRHLIRGNLQYFWHRGFFYIRRWLKKNSAAFRRRLGTGRPYSSRRYPPPRRPKPPFRISKRLLFQAAFALVLALMGFLMANYPLETGELITKAVSSGARCVASGYRWVKTELYPSLVFSFQADVEISERILESGLPAVGPGRSEKLDLVAMTKKFVATVTSVNFDEVESILEAQFLGSDFEFPSYMTERAPDPAFLPEETKPQVEVVEDRDHGDEPLIAIYHTHSSEAYHGRDLHLAGEKFFPGDYCWGESTGVISVGDELARILADEYRIPVVHSRKIHDYPVFRDAYTNSRLTLENILREYPSVEIVIDLHRDGLTKPPEEAITTTVAGERLARVAIIVGKGRPGFTNPHWERNKAFAERLHQGMEKLYPGLSRGIIVKDWPYNQELHPQAVLVEIGDHYNTREEAIKSAHLVADVLAQLVQTR
ncbi:MAG: stage II sporulation protein P [Firmicutes bacterium]|nr:stage II sporulation protein P [Bacillota bacterium]